MDEKHTVTDRMRLLGIPEGVFHKQSVASKLSARWKRLQGEDPEFIDMPKLNGGGTHKMAIYPAWFWPQMDDVIRAALTTSAAELERQTPRPREVQREIEAKRKRARKDVTPPSGALFWFKLEEDPIDPDCGTTDGDRGVAGDPAHHPADDRARP